MVKYWLQSVHYHVFKIDIETIIARFHTDVQFKAKVGHYSEIGCLAKASETPQITDLFWIVPHINRSHA